MTNGIWCGQQIYKIKRLAANFVGLFEYKGYIYYWYSELASDAQDNNKEPQVSSYLFNFHFFALNFLIRYILVLHEFVPMWVLYKWQNE